jgi:hypothetical protein
MELAKCISAFSLALTVLATPAQARTLDPPEQCAEQARATFLSDGDQDRMWHVNGGWFRITEGFQSHYNANLAKCLMVMETTDTDGVNVTRNSTLRSGSLTLEYNRAKWWTSAPYASISSFNGNVNVSSYYFSKQSDVPKHFTSREQFDEFVAPFMKE